MATVTRENIGVLTDKIVVKVAKDDYLPSFEKAIKTYSKQANIPGFRKGMVPVGMVKKMYGSSVFADEVLKSVEKGLSDYMVNEKIEIFAQPLPIAEEKRPDIDMNNPAEYDFAFEIGLKPDFQIPDLAKIRTTRYKVKVTDEMIEEEVARFQNRFGKMTDPETISDDENVLNVSFVETDADGNDTEGGITKDNSLLLKYFKEEFRKNLLGKKAGDSVNVQLSSAFDDREREWIIKDLGLTAADADKHFKIVVSKIGFVEKAELNEELFKNVFPSQEIADAETFRNSIKEDIQKQWDAQGRNQIFDQIYHALIEQTNIEFPESFLKKWMQNGGEKPKTADEVEKEFPSFVSSLKWTLILDQLVKTHNIQVEQDDIRAFARQQLFSYMGGNMPEGDQPWVNDYVEKMMKDRKFVEDSFNRIQTEKTFAWAETQVVPEEKEISAADFNKMQEEHQHHH
ncbi:MAG: trigger factor [Gemmatimonadaceae bacterium]|nr:trigger factor [Chitinophagaceae bacterium]